MKIPKTALIEKACSGDSSRVVLANVFLDKQEDGRAHLYATNGLILAVFPVLTDEHDKSGYITPEALKSARKCAGKLDTVTFSANSALTMPDGQMFQRPDHGKYPNINQVIPKGEKTWEVTIDAELLYLLAQAIGAANGVTLQGVEGSMAIRVLPHANKQHKTTKGSYSHYEPACMDAHGVMMPIATAAKEESK